MLLIQPPSPQQEWREPRLAAAQTFTRYAPPGTAASCGRVAAVRQEQEAAVASAAYGIVVLVLAGGQGRRFRAAGGQGHKLDAVVAGRTVLESTLAQVAASGLPWRLVCPEHDSPSMGDTIVRGVQATAQAGGWLILPGDMPLVQPGSLRAVAQALQAKEAPVVVPSYLGQRGHPVGFAAACRPALLGLIGAVGARSVVAWAEAQRQLVELPLQDAGVVFDVDTPEDLALAEARLRTAGAQHR